MPAFCFKTLKLSLSETSLKLRFFSLHVRFFKSHTKISKTHHFKLALDDSQLLRCLSQQNIQQARNLLDKIPNRSRHGRIVYWTSLLTKYSRTGFIDEARVLFDIMPERNIVSYNVMLSGYLQCGRLTLARKLFQEMPERNVVSWTSMLCGLADAGRICEARGLFKEMPERNVVSWNAMVVGLIRNGDLEEARLVFYEIPEKNVVSFNAMIKGLVENGRMEEARVLFEEMEDTNVITWTSMIAGYCRVGDVQEAYCLFYRIPDRNVISWTAMISGFTWNGYYEEALLLFIEMKRSSDIAPNGETFVSLAYACAGMRFHHLGKQVHTQLIINGSEYDDYDGRLAKSLIHMYSSFGIMDYAHYIFNRNLNSYVVQSCNCMINGYTRTGQVELAQELFDTVPVRDKITWTSMINGYFNIGNVSEACYLFENMPDKDAIAWTAMISGLVQNELFAKATSFLLGMRAHGVPPLSSTYAILFGAAGAMAHLDIGRQLHSMLMKTLSDFDLFLGNSLISMYAKCGEIHDAYSIFTNMNYRDLISWNTMIMGLAHHGLANETLKVFNAMLQSGTCPNSVTFLESYQHLAILGWLVKDGKYLMQCAMFMQFNQRSADIAKHAARRLLELDPLNAPAHVALCNIYAASGQHVEEQKLRKEMGLKGVRKVPGCSWIVLNGNVHVFLSGDKLDPEIDEILLFLFQFDMSGIILMIPMRSDSDKPLAGKDWMQYRVAKVFSAIKIPYHLSNMDTIKECSIVISGVMAISILLGVINKALVQNVECSWVHRYVLLIGYGKGHTLVTLKISMIVLAIDWLEEARLLPKILKPLLTEVGTRLNMRLCLLFLVIYELKEELAGLDYLKGEMLALMRSLEYGARVRDADCSLLNLPSRADEDN
ncbi:unnamed protein product [Dovyalis caffra]|uniref:Uncharacterized protein n=1 Tax=Dovyalis caffra TaxID=77055 RepID=A0AAV1SQF6_9ROSI|nr:unnamed protein product [Dovyalis caffra]